MGCGCQGNNRSSSDRKILREHRASSAAMCVTCPKSKGIDPKVCSYNQYNEVPVPLRIIKNDCPLNRFPDKDGIIRWKNIRWYGVPMPIRIWVRLRHPKHPKVKTWSGCGCIVRLKNWVLEMEGKLKYGMRVS